MKRIRKAVFLTTLGFILLFGACKSETVTDTEAQGSFSSEKEALTEAEKTTEAVLSDSEKGVAGFDKIIAAGKALDEAATAELTAFLQNDGAALPWYFLGQAFKDPSEIDINALFYTGTDTDITEEEQLVVWEALDLSEWRLDIQKRKAETMKELFEKYTGTSMTPVQTESFSRWSYNSEYDAYYSCFTDTEKPHVNLGRAYRVKPSELTELGLSIQADEVIALEWTGTDEQNPSSGMMILIPEGDTWRIAANIFQE